MNNPVLAHAAEMRRHWLLEPYLHFLNHGSYGAAPRIVLDAQQAWRDRLERQPVQFMADDLPGLLRKAAGELAGFLGARSDDLAFVENATAGVNAVLRSFPWRAGDELLLASHAYPAVKNVARFVARQNGIELREFAMPFPLQDRQQILEPFAAALSPRTRMALLDHVSSPLAVVYPLQEMIALCRARGVQVLVDGAHAPGMLPLSLEHVGADWYVGNAHKWLYAPKGCGFLWAAPHASGFLQPPVVSLRMDEGFPLAFDWVGTRDPSAWLAVGSALQFYRNCGGSDIPGLLHEVAIATAARLCAAWDVRMPAPPEMLVAMATLPLPLPDATPERAQGLHAHLRDRYRVEVPVLCFNDALWVRVSSQLYNTVDDYAALENAVLQLQ